MSNGLRARLEAAERKAAAEGGGLPPLVSVERLEELLRSATWRRRRSARRSAASAAARAGTAAGAGRGIARRGGMRKAGAGE